jgi:acyl carrier protein
MSHTDVYNKVISILHPFVRNEAGAVNLSEDTSLIDDLNVNSARMVDIVLEIEDQFGISVDDDSMDKMRSVGDAVGLVERKLAA